MTSCPPCGPSVDRQERAKFQFEIPRFSATASQLVDTLNKSETNVPAVVQLIECEPTISSQVVRLANSPIYGASRAISTIGHAIVVLGFRCVAQQAIASASGALFKAKNAACEEHRLDTYTQSLGVATTARFLAKRTKITNPDEAFLCGVVHDIGKLILFQHAGKEYAGMLDESPHEKSLAPEIESYGITHASLGRECGVAWSLPTHLCTTIANHHRSLNEAVDPLSRTLICAAYLAKKWQLGFCEKAFTEDPDLENELCDFQEPDVAAECREQFEAICDICLQ